MRKVAVLATIFLSNFVYAGWLNPKDYDECVLESMKGVTSDVAAKSIQRACSNKFPPKEPKTEDLPQAALQKIDASAGFGGCLQVSCFTGKFYNGNSEWTVVSLKIRIRYTKSRVFKDYQTRYVGGSPYSRYAISTDVGPLATGNFGFEVYDTPDDYSWTIVGGKGFRN